MNTLSKAHERSIKKYEQAFGPKKQGFDYLIKPISGKGVVVSLIVVNEGVYVVKDQVLISGKKIYRNFELVKDLTQETT